MSAYPSAVSWPFDHALLRRRGGTGRRRDWLDIVLKIATTIAASFAKQRSSNLERDAIAAANRLRAVARRFADSAPGMSADLRAAADRHELTIGS